MLPLLLAKQTDPVELATRIAALSKGSGGGMGDLDMVLELADRLNKRANGEGDISIAGVLKDNLPTALDVAGRFADRMTPAAANPREVAPRIPPPRPAIHGSREVLPPSPVHPHAPIPEPAPVADAWTPMEPHMNRLAEFARTGKDPYKTVQMALLLANDEQIGMLREKIREPEIAKQIVTRFPAFASYPAWLEEFLHELHEEFYPSPDDGPDPDDVTPDEPETVNG